MASPVAWETSVGFPLVVPIYPRDAIARGLPRPAVRADESLPRSHDPVKHLLTSTTDHQRPTAGNFRANIGGKPILVTSANYDSAPRRIVILIDAGESMTGSGRWKWGLEFAQSLIGSASPQHSLALLTFGSKIENTIEFG